MLMYKGADALSICFNTIVRAHVSALLCTLIPLTLMLQLRQCSALDLAHDPACFCLPEQAILFLCEVDNIAFMLGLSERVRRRVETAGRVDLGDKEADALARTKVVHIGLIMVCVPASLWAAHFTASFGACFVAVAAIWIGGLVEAFVPGATPGETARRVGETVLEAFVGFGFGFLVLALRMMTGHEEDE
jgi:hypothetical protein